MKFERSFLPRNLFASFEESLDISDDASPPTTPPVQQQSSLSFSIPAPDFAEESSCDSGFSDDTDTSFTLLSPSPRRVAPKRLFIDSPELPVVAGRKRNRNLVEDTPPRNKRMRVDLNFDKEFAKFKSNDKIKQALNRTDYELTGDFSRTHCLPTVPGKHSDLQSISPTTTAQLINGHYDSIADHLIVDCRYPYEYEGGHLPNAVNLYTHNQIRQLLHQADQTKQKRQIIVFHCEFSSERGPKLLRFLRSQDRLINAENYPKLNYPEIYILDGGYKNFYEQCPEYGLAYRPMLDRDYQQELKYYRNQGKSAQTMKRTCRNELDTARIGLQF